MQVNISTNADSVAMSSSMHLSMSILELNKLLPTFDPKETDISIFFESFEKQFGSIVI